MREIFWWEIDHMLCSCTLLSISKPWQENASLTCRGRCRRSWSHWPGSTPPSPSWLACSWKLIFDFKELVFLERENFWLKVLITFDPGNDALRQPSPAKKIGRLNWFLIWKRKDEESTLLQVPWLATSSWLSGGSGGETGLGHKRGLQVSCVAMYRSSSYRRESCMQHI